MNTEVQRQATGRIRERLLRRTILLRCCGEHLRQKLEADRVNLEKVGRRYDDLLKTIKCPTLVRYQATPGKREILYKLASLAIFFGHAMRTNELRRQIWTWRYLHSRLIVRGHRTVRRVTSSETSRKQKSTQDSCMLSRSLQIQGTWNSTVVALP